MLAEHLHKWGFLNNQDKAQCQSHGHLIPSLRPGIRKPRRTYFPQKETLWQSAPFHGTPISIFFSYHI